MVFKTWVVGVSALLYASSGDCVVTELPRLPLVVTIPNTLVTSSTSSLTSTISSAASSTSSLTSSVSPSPSAVSDALTCTGKDTGFTFTHATSKETYDITCGADYRNGDFKSLWTDSFDGCIAACDEESSCVTVAFRSGTCYLKNRITGQVSDAGVWSAKKQSAATAPSNDGPTCENNASDATTYQSSNGKKFKITCGKEFFGGDLTSTSTSSFKECIETCTTNTDCVDVSYVDGTCYLKRSTSSLVEARHVWTAELIDTSATSSASPTASAAAQKGVTCANNKDNNKPYTATNGGAYIVECGVDYFGGDLQAVDSATFAACMDACDSTDGCVDVSYVYGRCYMKSSLTTSSPARDVWTGRKTSSGPSDTEILSYLNENEGSFCTSFIGYEAPVTTEVTTATPGASTVLSLQTQTSFITQVSTAYVTTVVLETLPALNRRQAIPTPSIVSQWPASRISSICSLVATGSSTTVSTATATVAPVTSVSTVTTVVPVTVPTTVTTIVTSTTRAVRPTAANLDFEAGQRAPEWQIINTDPIWRNNVIPGGHYRSGVPSYYAARIARTAGVTTAYSNSRLDRVLTDLVVGQTYRIEFSWRYGFDVDSSDRCTSFFRLWGVELATLTPSTRSGRLAGFHLLRQVDKCGTSTALRSTILPPQALDTYARYTAYFRAPPNAANSPQFLSIGHECPAGTYGPVQNILFDDIVIAPEAAC